MNITPKNILLRMPNEKVEAILATSLIGELKAKWPNSRLTLMCQGEIGDLFLSDPRIDELFTFVRPSGWIHRMGARNILNPLKHGQYDLGIDASNTFISTWWLWRGKVQNRIGFSTFFRRPFLDFPVRGAYADLLRPLQIEMGPSKPKLSISPEEIEKGRSFLQRWGVPPGGIPIMIDSKEDSSLLAASLLANPGVSIITLPSSLKLRERMAVIASSDLIISDNPETELLAKGLKIPFLARSTENLYRETMRVLEKQALG